MGATVRFYSVMITSALFAIACGETGRRPIGGSSPGQSASKDGSTNSRLDGDTVPTGADGGPPPDAGTNVPPLGDGGLPPPRDSGTTLPPQPDSGTNTPPRDSGTNTPPADAGTGPTGTVNVGAVCSSAAQCAPGAGGSCISGTASWWTDPFVDGYCTLSGCGMANPCPGNSSCIIVDQAQNTTCLADCTTHTDCRSDYYCHAVGVCLPGARPPPGTGTSPVGGPCMVDGDCAGAGATCLAETGAMGPTGFVGGYCTIFSCDTSPCPGNSTCYTVNSAGDTACLADCQSRAQCRGTPYACHSPGACLPACDATSCDPGEVCGPAGLCITQACTPGSCGTGLICDMASGQCVADTGTPPPGPIPTCNSPSWQCQPGNNCNQLTTFQPRQGPGYDDYEINQEGSSQYRSYLARDAVLLHKYAAAEVNCLAANWPVGNGAPIGLGDMSEANGDIPGTAIGQPGHPMGTHVNGRDMDLGYYQLTGTNNYLRAICEHRINGADQYHCVGPPTNVDVWRTALYIGKLHDSPRLRVIGVDGQVGLQIESALTQLCARGWLNNDACSANTRSVTWEVTDTGRGWFAFHHHHFHVSISAGANVAPLPPVHERCLLRSCAPAVHGHHNESLQSIDYELPHFIR